MVIDIEQDIVESDEDGRVFYTLLVIIDEGEQFTLGEVNFLGNQIYTDDELQEQLRMMKGDVLNLDRFEADYQRIVNLYYDDGYVFNTISRAETRDDENNIISFNIQIIERDRAHIERIVIRGNTKTKDRVILRELPFEVGEVFSASQIRRGILNLYNLQFFSNILPETPPGSSEGLIDMIINVEEGQTADIRFGLAFGGTSEFPISLQLGWQDRNFLGNGNTFGINVLASFIQQQVDFNFVEPWLGDERTSFGINLGFNHSTVSGVPQDILTPIFGDNDSNAVPDPFTGQYLFSEETEFNGQTYRAGDPFPSVPTSDDLQAYSLVTDYEFAGGALALIPPEYLMQYEFWSAQVGLSLGRRIPTQAGLVRLATGLSTGIEFIDYNPDIFRPFDPLTRDGLHRIGVVNRLLLRAALDDRDLFYNPSSGYYLGQVFTLTGGFLFGDRHYIRSDTRGEIHFTLFDIPVSEEWNFKFVLGLQTLFSTVVPHFFVPEPYNEQEQPVASSLDLLYIDGVFFGRGWPRALNGEALWDSIIELRMPIAEQIVWLDLFFETAVLWQNIEDIPSIPLEDELRFTIGGGVRFTIPQFPIRLYFTKRFAINNGQVAWQTGPLFNANNVPGEGIDFVFTIGTELF